LQILITALVLGGISAVLAAIISVADAVLNNYGDVKLTVNGSKTYTVKGGSTLLTTLAGEKIFIPSASAGKAVAGSVKSKFSRISVQFFRQNFLTSQPGRRAKTYVFPVR